MESQTDRYVSTLRRCVEAMGGELRSVAHCPQGAVEISPFQREAKPTEPAAAAESETAWPSAQRLENPCHAPTPRPPERAAALGKRRGLALE